MSVGDLIEGGADDVSRLNSEWNSFSNEMEEAGVPFYPVVGNHDISNIVQRHWWEKNVGPRYYHMRHKNLLF